MNFYRTLLLLVRLAVRPAVAQSHGFGYDFITYHTHNFTPSWCVCNNYYKILQDHHDGKGGFWLGTSHKNSREITARFYAGFFGRIILRFIKLFFLGFGIWKGTSMTTVNNRLNYVRCGHLLKNLESFIDEMRKYPYFPYISKLWILPHFSECLESFIDEMREYPYFPYISKLWILPHSLEPFITFFIIIIHSFSDTLRKQGYVWLFDSWLLCSGLSCGFLWGWRF
jgi:hypothetical protein